MTLFIGALTALVGGLLAGVQHDIKKVLAYSTISQLGYMFVALGRGQRRRRALPPHDARVLQVAALPRRGRDHPRRAHAGHARDGRAEAQVPPWTTATFTIGSLALAGVFPISGFWSQGRDPRRARPRAALRRLRASRWSRARITAFYVARLWFRVFAGPTQTRSLHEGHLEMIAPMVVLAGITLVRRLRRRVALRELPRPRGRVAAPFGLALSLELVAVAGLALGWWVYGAERRDQHDAIKQRVGYAYDVLVQKLYFDITYEYLFIRPYMRLADVARRLRPERVDGVVNGSRRRWVRATGRLVALRRHGDRRSGERCSRCRVATAGAWALRIQIGDVQTYQRLARRRCSSLLVVYRLLKRGAESA